MSLAGLAAYGDSDESDEETSDTAENGLLSETASKSAKPSSPTLPSMSLSTKPKTPPDSPDAQNVNHSSAFIGSIDDIEDDDPTPTISQNPFSVLNLPAPKHSSDFGPGGDVLGFLGFPTANNNKRTGASLENTSAHNDILEEDQDSSSNPTNLLAGLPTPKPAGPNAAPAEIEEDEIEDEIKQKTLELKTKAEAPPQKPKRQPVKITIPQLPQYDSDEEEAGPAKKKRQAANSGGRSGLFSLLPDPKNMSVKTTNRPLLPYTLKKKPAVPAKPTPKPKPPTVSKPKPALKPSLVSGVPEDDSDEEEKDEGQTTMNFFSLGGATAVGRSTSLNMAPDVEKPIVAPQPVLSGPWQRPDVGTAESRLSAFAAVSSEVPTVSEQELAGAMAGPSMPAAEDEAIAPVNPQYDPGYQQPEESEVQQFMQDEEFLRLAGKRKRGRETIDFIDVSADHNITQEELTKHITEEVPGHSYSKKNKDLPSQQSRRKHQITYLAHQAKEREMELKNQWANNRMTKKQTQAKYGF